MRKLNFLLVLVLFSYFVLPSTAQTADTVYSSKSIKYENKILKGQLDFSLEEWRDNSWTIETSVEMNVVSETDFNLCVSIYDTKNKPYIFKILGIHPAGEYTVTVRMWFMPDGKYAYEISY